MKNSDFQRKFVRTQCFQFLFPSKRGQDRDPILHLSTAKHQFYRFLVVDFWISAKKLKKKCLLSEEKQVKMTPRRWVVGG